VRYVALGDSYTIGTSVAAAERFPDQLVLALAVGWPSFQLEIVANLGVDGYATSDVIREELPVAAALAPEVATLLIGVNDVVQGVPLERYEANAAAILDVLLGPLSPDRLLVVSVPDYTVTPAGADYGTPAERSAGIRAVNARMAGLAADRGVAFVDVTDISLDAATDPALVASDGLHPSGSQYARWVARIAPVLRERLVR
jgi:lysophospholipase L1-like esterase